MMSERIDFEEIFNRSPNPYMVLDRGLNYVAVNDAYLRVTSRRREELIGRNLFEAFPGDPEDADDSSVRQLRASLERVLSEGEPDTLALIRYAIPRRTPEGVVFDERYWSATHTPILDERGEVALILQHTVDVTELQQLKQELRAAKAALHDHVPMVQMEEGVFRRAQVVQEANRVLDTERRQLRRLFEQAPGFIAVLRGPRHVFQLVNEAYFQVVGHRDIVGKPVREALPEVEGQGFFELLDEVYATGEPFTGRGIGLFLQREPGAGLEEVYVDFVYQPVFETDGSVSGLFVQGHDVTEQKQAQAELRELNETLERRVHERTKELQIRNRELQDFAYVASHDLQEPLRKISAFAELLQSDHADRLDEEGAAFVGRMRRAAIRMSTLIEDLLAFSRVATRMQPVRRVDLDDVAEEVRSALQIPIEETGADVCLEPLPVIEADPTQMYQLLQNLISNALKFRRPEVRPVIQVRGAVERSGGSKDVCRLEVEDNGIGFDEKYLDRIFTPFQRLHGRSAYEGTGMGLAICRRIAERHGGTITAHSTPGEGSRFIVFLPVRQEEDAYLATESRRNSK